MPTTDPSPITQQVCEDLKAREQLGYQKYGKPLEPHDGRDSLQDAYEECLDMAQYLKKAMIERGWQPIATAPKDGTWLLLFRYERDGNRIAEGKWGCGLMGTYGWGGNGWSYPLNNKPTHWMPLPSPPKE